MAEVKKGDRVRVTIEGVATYVSKGYIELREKEGGRFLADANPDLSTVEVLPPPVEQFRPGDVVRNKTGRKYVLGAEGYLSLQTHRFVRYVEYGLGNFTSEFFERVEV